MPCPQVITPFPVGSVKSYGCLLNYCSFCALRIVRTRVPNLLWIFFSMMNCHLLCLTAGADTTVHPSFPTVLGHHPQGNVGGVCHNWVSREDCANECLEPTL